MTTGIRVERGYVSATVAATLLGVSRQRVNQLLKAGKLAGAFLMDCGDGEERWCVPRTAIHERLKGLPHEKATHDRDVSVLPVRAG